MVLKYVNSKGQELDFASWPYYMLAPSELFDYEWQYTTRGINSPRVDTFYKTMVSRKAEVDVCGATEEEFAKNLDHILDVVGYDVAHKQKGRFYYGEYFFEGYCVAYSNKERPTVTKMATIDLTFLKEKDTWLKIVNYHFGAATNPDDLIDPNGLDYEYDYEYDYTNVLYTRFIMNDNYQEANFKMRLFGQCTDPAVSIGSNSYAFKGLEVATGEYVVIDSVEKEAYVVRNNGLKESVFGLRNRDNYLYQPIEMGNSSVAWSGAFTVSVDVYLERSAPQWQT